MPIQPFAVKSLVDLFGIRLNVTIPLAPCITKRHRICATAITARPMACRECGCFIEKNNSVQLRPPMTFRLRPLYSQTHVIHAFDDQRRLSNSPCRGIMNDPAIAGEAAAMCCRDDLAERCHAILQRHGTRPEKISAQNIVVDDVLADGSAI